MAKTTYIRLVAAVAALVIWPSAAMACIRVGVYQDRPGHELPAARRRRSGPGVTTVSVYVGARELVDPRVIAMARDRHLLLVVAWQPDDRTATLARVADGRYDKSLRRLVRQLRGLEPKADPAPDARAEHALVRVVGRGRQAGRGAVRAGLASRAQGRAARRPAGRIRLMWTPYARSVPDEAGNRIRDYFPGRDLVDAVGAVGYNFGTTDVLDWTAPQPLFARRTRRSTAWPASRSGSPRRARRASAARSRTGSGGSARIRHAMPRLRGVLWYDVREPNGDFRITQTPATTAAFTGVSGRRLPDADA